MSDATLKTDESESSAIQRIRATQKLTGSKQEWLLPDGRTVELITLDELEGLQREVPNIFVMTVLGERRRVSEIDNDTYGIPSGMVACGFLKGEFSRKENGK